MGSMIQVRNVPDVLHRSLKARAAMAGMSLSDYLLGELREIAERPTLAEFRLRLHDRKPVSAALGTIRRTFSSDSYALAAAENRALWNLFHCSENLEEAKREYEIWFGKNCYWF